MNSPAKALLAILVVLSVLWPNARVTPFSSYDQRFYLGIAYDLREHGIFTDGFAYGGGGIATPRPPGMRFTPLYPGFLAVAASLDSGLRQGMLCVERTHGSDASCPRRAPVARTAQFLMLAAFYWLLWTGIRRVEGERVAWLALLVALPTAPGMLLFVNTLMTETLSLLLSGAACVAAAFAAGARPGSRAGVWGWSGCGMLLGLAALNRPAFLMLLWAGMAVFAVLAIRARDAGRAARGCAFAGGAALAVLPWVLRNLLVLHRAALTFGYASHTLIQRAAFDAMSGREYAMSFVCWLPNGSGLGTLLAGRHACDRFGWDEHPNSFYSIGTGRLLQDSLARAGGLQHHMAYVLHHYVLAHPWRHLLTTLPFAMRGMMVFHEWGLLLGPLSLWTLWRACRERRAALLWLSVPAWLMLLVNAAVAVNQPRYNFLLVVPFSLAGAKLAQRWLDRFFARGHRSFT